VSLPSNCDWNEWRGLQLSIDNSERVSYLTPVLVHAAFNSGVIFKDYLMAYHPGLVRRILGYD